MRRRYLLTGGLVSACWPQISPFVRVRELSSGNKKRKRAVPPLRRVNIAGRSLLGVEISSVHVHRLEAMDFLYGRFSTRAWDEAGFPTLDFRWNR